MSSTCLRRARGRGRVAAPWLALALLVSSCQTARPDPDAEGAITRALGLGGLVVFRIEGGPIDEPTGGSELTLADAVRRAVLADPGLQASLARVRASMADADQARLLPNPVMSFVLRWGPGKPQIEAALAQDLIEALQIPRRSSAADNRLRQAAADAVTVALDLVAEVQTSYALAQASDRLLPSLESRLDVLSQLASIAESRLNAGEGVRSDLTTLRSQRVELEVDIADARLNQREGRLRLARLIGEPSAEASWGLEPQEARPAAPEAEGPWIRAALRSRPEVQSVAWQLAALGDDEALARFVTWEGAEAGADATRDDSWFAGPSLSAALPVFDTGQARRAHVRAEQIEARHALVAAQRRVIEEVRLAHHDLTASAENLRRVREEWIPLQILRRQQAEEAYRAGLADATALFLAEQDLRAAESRALDVELRTVLAFVRLQRAVGGPGIAVSGDSSLLESSPGARAVDPIPDQKTP